MIAERITRILRRRYAEQPRFDNGDRARLGELRPAPTVLVMAAKDAPPPISTKSPGAVSAARGTTRKDPSR
jgi:hypothetical protein